MFIHHERRIEEIHHIGKIQPKKRSSLVPHLHQKFLFEDIIFKGGELGDVRLKRATGHYSIIPRGRIFHPGYILCKYQGEAICLKKKSIEHNPIQKMEEISLRWSMSHRTLLVLHHLIGELKDKNGLEREGLFRIAPEAAALNVILRDIDRVGVEHVHFESVEEIAALVKMVLKNLTPRTITQEVYQSLKSLYQRMNEEGEDLSQQMREIIEKELPSENLSILKTMIALFQEIDGRKELNRMPLSNLAVIFAPSLLPEYDSDLEAMISIKGDTRMLCFIIELYAKES